MAWVANGKSWAMLLLAAVLGGQASAGQQADPASIEDQAAVPQAAPEPSSAPPTSILPDFLEDIPPEPVTAPEVMVDIRPPPPAMATPSGEAGASADQQADAAAVPAEPVDPLANLIGPVANPEDAGLLGDRAGGLGSGLFDGSDGRFVGTLLRGIDAPLASRWMQIVLNRALLTRARAPLGINPSDWVAARGEALVAIGSATDAHRMIGRIVPDRYTAGLYAVAANAAIASANPLALCPLSETALSISRNPFWMMIDSMCQAIAGEEAAAARTFDQLRRRGALSGFDVGLAERLSSATGGGRRGSNPAWDEVGGLSAWRMGAASAAGLEIPDSLLETATPAQKAWMARMAGQPMARRLALMPEAAAIGALSAAEANRVLAASIATLDPSAVANSPGGQARTAQTASDAGDRVDALQALMRRGAAGSAERHGWQVAAAVSAARVPPSAAALPNAPEIVGALLTAGLVRPAKRWWTLADGGGTDSTVLAPLWAQMAPVDPSIGLRRDLFDEWAGTVPPHRAALLAAGLRGLGRGEVGPAPAAITNGWTDALDNAVAARRRGEVIVLAATGMQLSWAHVPPDYLRRIAAALVAVGLRTEAGLIVAEAANRG